MTKKTIAVGIVAHVDAGKTTLTEQMLYHGGIIKEVGRVDTGNTVTDGMALERERGITIRATTVAFPWQESQIQLLDTPGHVDFVAEVERALSVLDAAVLVISAKEGVQGQTKVLFNVLRRLGIPTILWVNKVDRMGVDLPALYDRMRQQLTPNLVFLQSVKAAGSREACLVDWQASDSLQIDVLEALSLYSDTLLEALVSEMPVETLLPSGDLTQSHLWEECQQAFNKGDFCPVLHGAALHGLGVQPLIDFIDQWVKPKWSPETEVPSVLIYKVLRDPKLGRICYGRVYGGTVVMRQVYDHPRLETGYKVKSLYKLAGSKLLASDSASVGEIVAFQESEAFIIGDWLGSRPEAFETVTIAKPAMVAEIPVLDLADRRQVLEAMTILTDEDPFLDFSVHPVTEAIEMKLFGSVQKQIVEALLLERFGIEKVIGEPRTIYKYRPKAATEAMIPMYREGNRLAAEIGLKIEPLPLGSGPKYETRVSYGDLLKTFQNAVEEGCLKGLETTVYEWAVTDCLVQFVHSEYDSVMSTPSDYRKLAPSVIEKALNQCGVELLEPLYAFEMHVPTYALGRAIADLLKMRAQFADPHMEEGFSVIRGDIPVDEVKHYLVDLLDYTEGQGVMHLTLNGYQVAPQSSCQ